ncbi:MAG: glycine cleavage system aminomethyltransferase GcvT [Chthoniobacterales bacterium]
MSAVKRTPLYDEHVRLGAKMIPFGAWEMPVQYSGIVDEHQAVRKNVGVFDISHMGQLIASGENASEWLNRMLTNNIDKLDVRGGQYTFLLNQNGGIIDDLIAYRIEANRYLLVVNASRSEEDFAWLNAHILPGVTLENRSDNYAGLAIQGPRIGELFRIMLGDGFELPARNTIADTELNTMPIAIARTGYTGEDGVEVFMESKYAPAVWTTVLDKGKPLGIRPCGLGARDTLRLEMCYPLNGNDLTPEHNPLEAGLGFFVDLTKPNFTGREVLAQMKEQGLKRRLVPFRMQGKTPPPRPHYSVFRDNERLAEITSGTLSPSLGYGIGMAYLPSDDAKIGTELQVEIRGQKFPAVIEKKPLYKKQS